MKNKQLKLVAMALLALLLMPSCASIVSDKYYNIPIDSNPKGSMVTITNRNGAEVFKGMTPTTARLKASAKYMSGEKYMFAFTCSGYKDQQVTISTSLNEWYFGKILIGGLIGMLIVDPLTGAMYKLDDRSINAVLEKESLETKVDGEIGLKIIDLKDLSEDMRKDLVRIN